MTARFFSRTVLCLGIAVACPGIASHVERLLGAPTAPPAAAASDDDDAAAKNAIFNSDDWRRTRAAFDDWLSVQKIYSAKQVDQIKARFRKQIAVLSAPELQTFLDEMKAKLAILLSPEAGDDRYWLGQFASPRVVFSQQELQQFDIVTNTAAQMEAELRAIAARRASRQSTGNAYNQMREQQVARMREDNRRQQQASQQAHAQAESAQRARAAQQSHLAPPKKRPPPPQPQMHFYVGSGGQIGYSLPIGP